MKSKHKVSKMELDELYELIHRDDLTTRLRGLIISYIKAKSSYHIHLGFQFHRINKISKHIDDDQYDHWSEEYEKNIDILESKFKFYKECSRKLKIYFVRFKHPDLTY